MAGAIDKKKNEVIGELEGAPVTHRDARSSILSDIGLSREFAATFLNAICEEHTNGKNESGATVGQSLATVCEALAKQRVICYGASSLVGAIRKFTFPPVGNVSGTVNGALGLTEANTSIMGVKVTDLAENNTITLQNTAGTQTIDGNTFSTQVTDYYMVRSRVSGELETTSGNLSAYTTPDGGDIVFGNTIAWGSSVAGEEEANTWNYHWAKANLASIVTNNPTAYNEITILTLADHLTQGSNTNYTPLGPGFGNKFYLKRHADSVNTFTITGTTSINSVSITGVSEADLAKVKHGDVISGTGIPDDNVTILAVQTDKSTIRLSETGVATADGIVTLTVNSVPVGHAAHDIFCQVEVVAEGLVTNDAWRPVGDGNGDYSGANDAADDTLVATTSDFIGMLGFFDPSKASGSGSNDLTKGASASYPSSGKEYGTSYPGIENNPFKPSNGGTTKAYETEGSGATQTITGTQPTNLGNKDVWTGRFVRFDFERAGGDPVAPLPEFRYVTDSAEKFYYAPQANTSYSIGNISIANHPMPNTTEPRATLPRNGLTDVIGDVVQDEELSESIRTSQGVIPVDTTFTPNEANATSGTAPSNNTSTLYRLKNGAIEKCVLTNTYTQLQNLGSNAGWTSTPNNWSNTVYNCLSNWVERKFTTNGSTANDDVTAIASTVSTLVSYAKFRDAVQYNSTNPVSYDNKVASNGISDEDFDTYIQATAGGTHPIVSKHSAVRDALDDFYTYTKLTGSPGTIREETGTQVKGTEGDFHTAGHAGGANGEVAWNNYSAEASTVLYWCQARVNEIDARIGTPTYNTETGSGVGNAPDIRVTAIPGSPAEGELVPYGRALYNSVNHMLGQDVDLLGAIIKDIESLTDLIDLVKNARNKYEIFSGRDKPY